MPDKRGAAKEENDRLKKKPKTGDVDVGERETKRKRLGCFNVIQIKDMSNSDIEKQYLEEDPLFVVANNHVNQSVRDTLCQHQRDSMKYFITLEDKSITTNSAAVAGMLKIDGLTSKEISGTADGVRNVIKSDISEEQVE